MQADIISEIPYSLALLLIARQRYDEVNWLISQTESVLNLYSRLISDTGACIQELPDDEKKVAQLRELLEAARAYTAHHQAFTEKLDIETAFRRDGGSQFYECMVTVISERQHLLDVVRSAEKRYVKVAESTLR